jgi:hypothetical protein
MCLTPRVVAALLVVPLLGGCAGRMREQELHRVAKDWSMVIRASQVIPVYPLTEDLQPGDVFLVQVPVDDQARIYRERGFLALDNLLQRLDPSGYAGFYDRSFEVGDAGRELPKIWLDPDNDTAWGRAPKAAFPSFSFSARSGGGLGVALPVQGVPVGLGLLGGEAAHGTITIADARTYGVDTISLYRDVLGWGAKERDVLRHFAPADGRQNYLRVVSRVYLTGQINTALQSSRDVAGSVSGGVPKPVDLVVRDPGSTPQEATLAVYESNVARLNGMIKGALERSGTGVLPGGSVKVVAASSGSVVLAETFPRPLVVGYLGFDVPILRGGVLGPPIPTHSVLEMGLRAVSAAPFDPGGQFRSNTLLVAAYRVLEHRKDGDAGARALVRRLDALTGKLPERLPCNIHELRGPRALALAKRAGDVLPRGGFRDVTAYRGELATSLQAVRAALASPQIEVEGHRPRTAATERYLRDELARNEDSLRQVNEALGEQTGLIREAADYAAASED